MIIDDIKKQKSKSGIIHLSEINSSFEHLYQKLLEREKRIYSLDEIKLLPYATKKNPHKNEWELRTKSYLRFRNFLSTKKAKLNILDIGCGNGWMIGQLAKDFEHNYYGIDLNLSELQSAVKLFDSENASFIYGDILSASFPANSFDIVILNSSLQYFQDIAVLMKEILFITKSYSEIYVIDTPFYDVSNIVKEKNKSLKRFMAAGLPEMANKYFHHTFDELKYLRHTFLYNPYSLKNKLSNIVFEQDSPYPWIRITH